ncbi:hypothetical protein [Streptomyces sp. NPDC055109]
MAVEGEPLLRLWEGRWVVRRAWIMQMTGAAESTVTRWYTEREQRPSHLRHPEIACTVGRTVYFDQQAVRDFWTAWQQQTSTSSQTMDPLDDDLGAAEEGCTPPAEESAGAQRRPRRRCAWCGVLLTYAGRGRPPVYCCTAHRREAYQLRGRSPGR